MSSALLSAIERVFVGETLSAPLVECAFGELLNRPERTLERGALLFALAQRGETVEELCGMAQAMQTRLGETRTCPQGLVALGSTVDRTRSLREIWAAAAIVGVACGADLGLQLCAPALQVLGVRPSPDGERVGRGTFQWMGASAPGLFAGWIDEVRDALGTSTAVERLALLTHPARPLRHCAGVSDVRHCESTARAMGAMGVSRAVVVHGQIDGPGLAGVALDAPTRVAHWRDGILETFELEPQDLDIERHALSALAGGDPQENARAMRDLFEGARNAYREAVIYTGALALWAASEDDRTALNQHAHRVRSALDTGRAAQTLGALIGHANSSS